MTTSLPSRSCQACRADAPLATESQILEFMPAIPDWKIQKIDDQSRLTRSYAFKNYEQSLKFLNAIAAIAQEEGHHPLMILEIRQVQVHWWTHKIGGMHLNDFIMAAKCDVLFTQVTDKA